MITLASILPGSSSGRTADSGSVNRGSNPRPGAIPEVGVGQRLTSTSCCLPSALFPVSEGISKPITSHLIHTSQSHPSYVSICFGRQHSYVCNVCSCILPHKWLKMCE